MNTPPPQGNATRWLLLSVLVVIADQISKAYIVRHFAEFEFLTVLPVLDITRMHNDGAAFSFLAGASGWQRWLFIGLAVVMPVLGHSTWHLYRKVVEPDPHPLEEEPAAPKRRRRYAAQFPAALFAGDDRPD